MQHSDADRTMAPERYLLGEITGPELDDFEEHMFVCVECAAAVRAGSTFTDNARAVFREHPELVEADQREQKRENSRARMAFVWKWFSFPQLATSFAALGLLCFSGFQYVENVHLERGMASLIASPPKQEPYDLVPSSRGGAAEHAKVIPPGVMSFTLQLQHLPDSCKSGCTTRARDSKGHFLAGIYVPLAFSSDGKATLHLTRELMEPGVYTIVVKANGTPETAEYAVKL